LPTPPTLFFIRRTRRRSFSNSSFHCFTPMANCRRLIIGDPERDHVGRASPFLCHKLGVKVNRRRRSYRPYVSETGTVF
jgi:hypothetical protein